MATIVVLCLYYATLIAGLIYVSVYRKRLRRKLDIDTCCCECGLVLCCLGCALCQVSAAWPPEHPPGRVLCVCCCSMKELVVVPSLSSSLPERLLTVSCTSSSQQRMHG